GAWRGRWGPPRRIGSVEMVLPAHGRQRLVEDVEARQGLLLADHQGWIEPDRWRVRHRHEAPAEAFLIERARDRAVERLPGRAVPDELDAEEQPAPPPLADRAVLFLHRLEPREHDAAHALGVLHQLFLDDDLDGRETRRRGQGIAAVARRAGARVGPGLLRRELLGRHDTGDRKAAAHAL